ncbi:hypothetical protein JCM19235_2109 [Vibrio maritimus]|uniref:Cation-transporting P-type ATPase N-terminal domain-containing protein n=1 Tax=Vibrio maritimus TaxID=990268 RepID=A0A090RTR7_9VIBR|nr:hypothetical protein JCM19235_2109 [Vibrio maritimus]
MDLFGSTDWLNIGDINVNNPWFNISTAGVINNLQTTKSSGLCSAEAASRLEHYGENALKEAPMKLCGYCI